MGKTSRAGLLAIRHPQRVEILRGLNAGEEIEPATYAETHGLPLATIRYHLDVLCGAEAITLTDGTARISEQGKALYELSLQSERRHVRDRRGRPRRQADWED